MLLCCKKNDLFYVDSTDKKNLARFAKHGYIEKCLNKSELTNRLSENHKNKEDATNHASWRNNIEK